MKRTPAVAGSFYAGNAEELRKDVEGLLKGKTPARAALGR